VGNAKGASFVGPLKLLRSRRDDALELLPEKLHHYLNEHIGISRWYPESDAAQLIAAAARLLPGPLEDALASMGESAVRDHVALYGELLTTGGPANRAFALWSTQHDSGHITRLREDATSMRFELEGFEDTSREMCLIIGGYMRGTVAVSGHPDAKIEKVECRLWGNSLCAWRCTWS
jgi:hypothetical protein